MALLAIAVAFHFTVHRKVALAEPPSPRASASGGRRVARALVWCGAGGQRDCDFPAVLRARRVWRAPRNRPGTASRRAPFCASSLKAQRVRRAPRNRPGTASRRAPFCASSLKAQRVRRAPRNRPGTASRRAPFCASSLKAQRVRRAPQNRPGTSSRRAPFCANSLKVYTIARITPPSARSAAPLVADDRGLQTKATSAATSSTRAKRFSSDEGRTLRKNSCSTSAALTFARRPSVPQMSRRLPTPWVPVEWCSP